MQHRLQAPFVALLLAGSPLGAMASAPVTSQAVAQAPSMAQASLVANRDTPSSAQILQEDSYILGPGDGLNLRFLVEEQFSGPVSILNDGTASLPLVGNVRLEGLTISQASLWLESLYKQQLLRPDLQLTVTTPRPLRIALVGQVERPGVYTLTSAEQSQTEASVQITGLPTLVDAIQKAGGLTSSADLRQVELQRKLPGENSAYKRARVNLVDLIREGDLDQNPILFDGDRIRILKAEETEDDYIEIASSTLSPPTINVNVVGEVESPGVVSLQANTPLIQAVLAAGGPQAWRANRGNVELVRINRNGTATRERFKLDYGQGVSNTKNPPLRQGDTVIVNRSLLGQTSDAIGAFAEPVSDLVTVFSLYRIIDDN